jgi:hypothetical protein
MSLSSYSKVHNLGHREILDIFKDEVIIQEKMDGSQFSFGVDLDGKLYMRSHHREIDLDNPPKMFLKGIEYVQKLFDAGKLIEGWIYRTEYFEKPKQNSLAYDRIPTNHLMLFDVDSSFGGQNYLNYEDVLKIAKDLDIEAVLRVYEGMVSSPEEFKSFLEATSVLGGQKVEGIVIKNYNRFTRSNKTMMGKFVSEKFKELNHKTHKVTKNKDILAELGMKYKSEARWLKAIQHLREQELITDSPKDIGSLMAEVNRDIIEECSDEIKEALFKWGWRNISREITRGMPQWYKELLLENAFKDKK